jgi:hypothetical protein
MAWGSTGGATQPAATQRASQSGTQRGNSVREQYRQLEAEMESMEDQLTRTDNAMLKDKVELASELFKSARADGEVHDAARNLALDSRCILKASRLGAVQASNLNNNTPEEFVRALRLRMGAFVGAAKAAATQAEQEQLMVPLNINELIAKSRLVVFPVHGWDSLWEASTLDMPEKERKAREKRKKDVLEAEVRPQELSASDVNNVTEATQKRRCDAMRDKIEKAQEQAARRSGRPAGEPCSINFFHVVINPDPKVGFGQTVENIFDFSFILKEGNLRIDMEDGEPMARTTLPPREADFQNGIQKVQNILKLDYKGWQALAKRYGAQRIMPTREAHEAGPSKRAHT